MVGTKSRANWSIPICLRVDCLNQGIKEICNKCYYFSNYDPAIKDKFTDAYKQPIKIDNAPIV